MRLLVLALLVIGAALRIYIYLQNRNLIIDEANVARNIYERGFIALLQPLDYYQYAPPVFLWITKLNTLLFGMGELSLRLYPLLCSLAALVLLYKLLKELVPMKAIWYPISLFVFCAIFIRYSSELKQYMPDICIALSLMWLALKVNMNQFRTKGFILIWIVVGSLAIWSSMPSVFILAGVGAYYGWEHVIRQKQYNKLVHLAFISAVWIAQFLVYYLLMLKEQANSDYLQNFHHYDFLFATPTKREEWQHNWYTFSALMRQFEGLYPYVHDINTGFIIAGVIMLFRKARSYFMLLMVPVLALCFAAAIDQFSLLPRVSLFIIPVLIVIIGYGFAQFAFLKSILLRGLLLVLAIYAAGCNIAFMMETPFKYEELTEGMQYLKDKQLKAEAISLYHSSEPAFTYYTQIHPDKEQWTDLKESTPLFWHTNYDSLSWFMRNVWSSRQPLGIIYTNCTDAEFNKRNDDILKHMDLYDKLDKPYIKTYIYIKPEEAKE